MLLVKIGETVKQFFKRILFGKNCSLAPLDWNFEKTSKISVCSPWFAESIGVLLVKIGGTVQKLFKRGIFEKKCSLAPLNWNFEEFRKFQFVPLGLLNRSVYLL
jgi:hypothetical protein